MGLKLNINELQKIKAEELFDGAVFYLREDDKTYSKCVVDIKSNENLGQVESYKKLTLDHAKAGRLFIIKDKPFKSYGS